MSAQCITEDQVPGNGETTFVVAGPPIPTTSGPPADTYSVSVAPSAVRPGGTLSYDGTCWTESIGAAQQVRLYIRRSVPLGSDLAPYGFVEVVPVQATGEFSGVVHMPVDAPSGDWKMVTQCEIEDQVPGGAEAPFTVAGPPIVTTTTSTTIAHMPPPPPIARPEAAQPRSGRAKFAG
jgi:hypothetical protein